MEKIQIKSIHAANFGPIKDLKADFALGDVLIVIGANESGKTHFTEGLFSVLKQKFPKIPVKAGEKKGGLKIAFSDGCEATYMAEMDGETLISEALTVTDKDGKRMGSATAKQYISQLIGNYGGGFSIAEFATTTAPQQRRALLSKLTLQSGSDLTAIDKANANYKAKFEDRTEANRRLEAQKARALPYDAAKAEMVPVDAFALSAQLGAIERHNEKYHNAVLAKVEIEKQVDRSIEIENLGTELAQLTDKLNADIRRLQEQFQADSKKIEEKVFAVANQEKEAKERLERANTWLSDPANALQYVSEIETQLADLTTTNQAISDAKRMKAEHDTLAELESEYQSKHDAVVRADAARKQAIATCKLPAGLTFSESGEDLEWGGFPLEKASKARKTMIGIELQLSQMGDLGFITADLSHLDADHLEECVGLIRANGLQAAIEISPRNKSQNELHIEIFEDHLGLPKREVEQPEAPTTLFP